MPDTAPTTVTRLLQELSGGNRAALQAVYPLVYGELRAVAKRHRRRWRGDHTIDTTALVHETYVKLAHHDAVRATSRAHFLAIAATAMRQVLCNYARDHQRLKRGGDARPLSLDQLREGTLSVAWSDEQALAVVALDAALERLSQVNPRYGRVVECRFFGGLSIEETADALGVSPATVKREWSLARAWLYRELHGHSQP
jgi:RNA polymerase sigma factor (TIGR02999 family)